MKLDLDLLQEFKQNQYKEPHLEAVIIMMITDIILCHNNNQVKFIKMNLL